MIKQEDYIALLEYYRQCFSQVNCFFFNSEVTQDVYSRYIDVTKSVVLPVTHHGIRDNRQKKIFATDCIRLAFIGSTELYKGFQTLKKILLKLNNDEHRNWNLSVWGNQVAIDKDCSLITYKGKYSETDIRRVYQDIDLLIVPSIWRETFSLVTLEAISYGVPVLVSDNVGAKDVVKKYSPSFIYKNEHELANLLMKILSKPQLLETYNQRILDLPWKYSYDEHVEKIEELYKSLL